MADEKSDQHLVAQLPKLEDNNFKFWMQSLTLIACGLAIHKYFERDNKPVKMSGNGRKLYYLLANTMLTLMSDKARHIATGGRTIQDLDPKKMVKKLTLHYLPSTKVNDIQIKMFANQIQTLVNWINAIEVQSSQQATPSLIGERDMIAVLIMDLLLEYNTKVTLINLDNKFKFKNVVELLRSQEQYLKINVSKSSSINSIQNATKERKYLPCNVCRNLVTPPRGVT
jgi:hypothetical protein